MTFRHGIRLKRPRPAKIPAAVKASLTGDFPVSSGLGSAMISTRTGFSVGTR